jgi:hypothetical protein
MSIAGRVFSRLPVASVVLAACALGAASAGYWFYVSQQREYIVGRDFRILSHLAKQVDAIVQAEVRILENLADDAATRDDAAPKVMTARWLQLRGKPYQASDIRVVRTPWGRAGAAHTIRTDGQLVLEVVLQPRKEGASSLTASIKLQRSLEPLFASRIGQGAFDAIVLGTSDGVVLIGAGQTAQQIRSSGLNVLSSTSTADGKPVAFAELAKSIAMADVSLAGVDYTSFLFPCCASADQDRKPLILVGLVRAETIRSSSWAISTTLVKVSILFLVVVVVAWPFLKLILLGERQQVRVADFFQLGASSVAGLAIITVVLLDVSAYRRLNRDLDAQLQDLADALDDHATSEIRDAYAQLVCLEDKVDNVKGALEDGRLSSVLDPDKPMSDLQKQLTCQPPLANAVGVTGETDDNSRLAAGPRLTWRYPFFETVAFIDRDGMQQIKLGTSENVSNRISVADREYFKTVMRRRGWKGSIFCPGEECALESVWSWTTGEPVAVVAKESKLKWGPPEDPRPLPVAAISIPMRSLIGPVLPPGFAFAVIDQTGIVLFHSDRQRNGSENLFVETDNNRRLRAQVAAHSAEPLSIRYWGSQYRAYVRPMSLPGTYVVAMAQKERAWAINREWLVVALLFLAIYLILWLVVALATLGANASWVWPDASRRIGYVGVSIWCGLVLVVALIAVGLQDRRLLLMAGMSLPLVGWIGTYLCLRYRPRPGSGSRREPLVAYSIATALVLLVTGVVPGALLFLASYQLHARSYIKNSQLIVSRMLSQRFDRLSEEYLGTDDGKAKPKRPAATHVDLVSDRDIYIDFLYNTSVKRALTASRGRAQSAEGCPETVSTESGTSHHSDDTVLSLIEDYLPYYSEASVEWRELLHDCAGDGSWGSKPGQNGIRDVTVIFTSNTGRLPVELTSWVPSITHVPPSTAERGSGARREVLLAGTGQQPVPTSGSRDHETDQLGSRDSWALLFCSGIVVLCLTGGVVRIFNRRIYLVGITEPLWACGQLASNTGENVLVLCDKAAKATQLAGITPLKLGPIVEERDFTGTWQRALSDLDARGGDGAVLIDDFDERLGDAHGMDRKLSLLEELVADQTRTVIVLSQVPLRGLTDSLRHSARVIAAARQKRASNGKAAATTAGETTMERWRRVLKAFVVVERREQDAACPIEAIRPAAPVREPDARPLLSAPEASSHAPSWSDRLDKLRTQPVAAFLASEGRSHPYVRRVCEDLMRSDAVTNGRLTRRQAFDEVAERTAQFYRGLWASCSEDEKVVLGHIAQHGLANSSVRSVVRRLLGRRLLCKDPALRPMNETFRRFVLTRECSAQVVALEIESGLSAWDRLRAPLGVAVVGVGVFLFATQKELYNAIFGLTTAAAASVPTLLRAVMQLVGRSPEGQGTKA